MPAAPGNSIAAANRAFYDSLWEGLSFEGPERFNTWPVVEPLARAAAQRLEIGPGLHPRLPVAGTCFLDLSRPAVEALSQRGGLARLGDATSLPYPDGGFGLVGAFDVLEHVADEAGVFSELRRVLRPGGTLIFSVPLHRDRWTSFDEWVGHVRRYDPDELRALLERHGFAASSCAKFGMRPTHPAVLKLGHWWMTRRRATALKWHNRVFAPLGLLLQRPLRFRPGIAPDPSWDGLLAICRKN